MLKGGIFALTNVAARLSSIMSPMVAEWMGNPSFTVGIVAAVAGVAAFKGLKKRNNEEKDDGSEFKINKRLA